jgi:hypothetical protein
MNDVGDILIDGKPFRVGLTTYKVKDIIDFAPRATVPGNSAMMSDLSLYQPLVQTDWQHGFGFHWYSDAAGYMTTVGNIDTRHDGLALMYTQSELSEGSSILKSGIVPFNGAIYSYGNEGLFKFDGTVWSAVYATGKVNYAINAGDYLLFCPDGARVRKMSLTGVVTDAGVDANATDYSWLLINTGFIYAGKDATNRIHYDTNADLSQLEGTTADPDMISAGIGNMPTRGAIVYGGSLYVSRPDGLWQIGEDKIARRVLDFTDSLSDTNFRSMAVVNGYLIFPIRDRIVQWNGSRTADITPTRITDEFPYTTYTQFKNFVSADNFLFCTARTNETVYKESLLCFDGVGWHKLTDIISDGLYTVNMLSYEAINNRLWFHVNDETRFIRMETSAYPYANFPTTGQHSIISSRLDMGFRRITKSMSSMFVEARNVTDDIYLNVYYSLDGSDWQLWDKVSQNGITELKFPGGYQTVEFNYALIRFDFITNDSTICPVLESYTLNFIMRPMTRMGYAFQIVAASNYEHDMYSDDRTAAEIITQLRDIRNSKAPVAFEGLMGESLMGYLTAIGESAVYRTEQDIEYLVQCSFVEMANDAD